MQLIISGRDSPTFDVEYMQNKAGFCLIKDWRTHGSVVSGDHTIFSLWHIRFFKLKYSTEMFPIPPYEKK